MDDFASMLTFELKEDLARRYFGTRKQIENDKIAYLSSLAESSTTGRQDVVHCITKICTLLGSADLCTVFFKFTGLPQDFLNTPLQPHDIVTSKRLIVEFKRRGITRRRRYRNTLYHLYSLLEKEVATYCEDYEENQLLYDDICDEINKFRRNFDLTTIFQFLREIDNPDRGRTSELGYQARHAGLRQADNDMEIQFPEAPQSIMVPIKRVQPLADAAGQLNELAGKGYAYTYLRKSQAKSGH
jgi:hypothetical protein